MRAKYIFEQFDSPEAKAKFKDVFSKKDLKNLIKNEPYKNKFNYGAYHGKDSAALNQMITDVIDPKDRDAIGLTEIAYRILVKNIPSFKKYKVNDLNHSDIHALHLQNKVKIPNERNELNDDYSAQVDLWITYFPEKDDLMDYEKGKFKIMLSPKVTTSRVGIGLHELPNIDKKGPVFGDFENEKSFDNFMSRISKVLSGTPDKEDKHFNEKLYMYEKNITLDEFLNLIPEIKKTLEFFNKYVQNKYNISII